MNRLFVVIGLVEKFSLSFLWEQAKAKEQIGGRVLWSISQFTQQT